MVIPIKVCHICFRYTGVIAIDCLNLNELVGWRFISRSISSSHVYISLPCSTRTYPSPSCPCPNLLSSMNILINTNKIVVLGGCPGGALSFFLHT